MIYTDFKKPTFDVDELAGVNVELENIEDDLIDFLGEHLDIINPLISKPSLQKIISETLTALDGSRDEYLVRIRQRIHEFQIQVKVEDSQEPQDVELDYEKFKNKVPEETDKGLAWFILWFGKYILKVDFLPDMCFVFSRIWKVLSQFNFGVQELDNQLIWNEVFKECQPNISNMKYFKGKDGVLQEFITRMCQFIAKTFS